MSEVLGAANIHGLKNKREFKKQFGEFIVGKRDIIKMDDRVVRARVRSADEFIEAHQPKDFGRFVVQLVERKFPNYKEENPKLYDNLKALYPYAFNK